MNSEKTIAGHALRHCERDHTVIVSHITQLDDIIWHEGGIYAASHTEFRYRACLLGLLLTFVGVWAILRQGIRSQEIAERIDLRLRRQFADVDRKLQEIKERLR